MPQLRGSVARSAHAPLHETCPVPHTHWPDAHVAPVPHRWPHIPQLFVSLARIAQLPFPHITAPAAHIH
jgi:hypothetical protein